MQKYRKTTQIIYVFLVILLVWLINPVMAGGGDPEVAEKAWPMLDNGALLIDVRSKEEFDEGHIDGALNIPWDKTDALKFAIGEDKQRQVVFYCRSGNRAGKARAELESMGYTNVFNATGFSALRATKPVD
ncbi:MAG: rhodanese-like domain-containing protein [Gammaproteobacteria bacterium]|nr:rhodanese-like domain-containing protein [Gammaproteobacteria bacterium]NNK98031.1 rhodanese-like domain-containing protein [Xanthomonadales bacterium]